MGLLAAYGLRGFAGGTVSASVAAFVVSALLLFTIRRLHDSGISRYWALLALFPFSITWDLGWFSTGPVDLYFVDFGDLIRNAPLTFGLLAPSSLKTNNVIAEKSSALEQS